LNFSFRFATRTPTGSNIRVGPCVQIEAIEADAPDADRHFHQVRPNLRVEPVSIHSQVARRITVPDQAREDLRRHRAISSRDWPASQPDAPGGS
jgi:hypothetical protein